MKALIALTILGLFGASAAPAHAFCYYRGAFDTKTTVAQEYRDSKWVVKAKVLSAKDFHSDTEESWTSYRLEVQQAFKGQPPKRLTFFTFRNSGGFYMDRPWADLPAGHDVGGEYLLFLKPNEPAPEQPREMKGSVFVNYNCGRSDAWSRIGPAARRELVRLQSRR